MGLGSSLPLLGPDWRPEAVAAILRTLPWTDGYSPRPATAILPGPPLGAQTVITAIPVTERLVIVEAPTGTGKTETAVLRALQLIAAGAVAGFYFAVPTRSAATELHDRVARLVATHSPALAGKVVRAVTGQLDTDPWQQPATPSWAIACPKRVMFAPAIVGTIDQAMLSTLRTTHAWLRHAALSRQLLIIDEAHASDPYMTEVIRTLVRRQLDLGGHVLLMSATLGESLRAELEGRPRMGFAAARAAPYPAVNGQIVVAPSSSLHLVYPDFLGRLGAGDRLRAGRGLSAGDSRYRHGGHRNLHGAARDRHSYASAPFPLCRSGSAGSGCPFGGAHGTYPPGAPGLQGHDQRLDANATLPGDCRITQKQAYRLPIRG